MGLGRGRLNEHETDSLERAYINNELTSGMGPIADLQRLKSYFRYVLFSDIQVIKQVGCIPPHYGELHRAAVVR